MCDREWVRQTGGVSVFVVCEEGVEDVGEFDGAVVTGLVGVWRGEKGRRGPFRSRAV